jgi:hypothetical protein
MNYDDLIEEQIRKQIEEAEARIELAKQFEKYLDEQD